MTWGSPVEVERRRRIRLAVAAYAYEFLNKPVMSDSEFDREMYLVDLNQTTDNPEMDQWFKDNFVTYSGMWIHSHPNKPGLERRARRWLAQIKGP